jgi:prepilin-type N-terminal cleavage/methylation domain-containing protein
MKRRGFTLTELLVVLAVIGTLAGIGIPLARSFIARSREAACLNNLRSLGVGLESYLQDHNGILPPLKVGRVSKTDDAPVLETVLLPYLSSAEAFRCPADNVQFEKSGCSYSWNFFVSDKRLAEVFVFGLRSNQIPLISDKEAWHPSGTNFLYADQTSSNKARFATSN